jgi:hypothetical protein
MGTIATALKHMLAAGMEPDAVVAAIEDMEASVVDVQAERRREKDRERKREKRLRKSADSVEAADIADTPSSPEVSPHTPFPNPNILEPLSPLKGPPFPSEFDRWYSGYPNKVQRGAAERAFPKARKLASLETLMAGVERYVACKPADRPYQNPATWLNGKGWLDEPAASPQARDGPAGGSVTMLDVGKRLLSEMRQADAKPDPENRGHHPPLGLLSHAGTG